MLIHDYPLLYITFTLRTLLSSLAPLHLLLVLIPRLFCLVSVYHLNFVEQAGTLFLSLYCCCVSLYCNLISCLLSQHLHKH